jgi:hypothetical protein
VIFVLFPPSLVLIAWGLFKGTKQLPERDYPIRDMLILSCGSAVGAGVILWVVYITYVLPAHPHRSP